MVEGLPRVLGDELRRARKRRGWTRKDLHARLGWNVSLQTLATYELGTRTLSVPRLVELAKALGVSAPDVLSRTLARLGEIEHITCLEIDLHAIMDDRTAGLAPLRRWAQARLWHTSPGQPTLARLEQPAIVRLAEICGVGVKELTATLSSLRVLITSRARASER